MNKMKKYFFVVPFFVLILFLGVVFSQESFSVIGSDGIMFSDSNMQAQYDLMCQENVNNCKDGIIDLGIISSFFEDDESKAIFEKNNEVRNFISNGAVLTQDIEIDNSGKVISGNIDFGSNSGDVSGFFDDSVKSGTIRATNSEFEKISSGAILKLEKEGANIRINNTVFRNIKPSEGSLIELNEKGEVVSANFLVNENGGNYIFGGTEFFAPAGSEVIFENGIITMNVPDGSRISKMPEMKDVGFNDEKVSIIGKNVILPDGHVLNDGVLNYKNGKLFVDSGSIAEIDNILIDTDGKYEIYFEDQRRPFLGGLEYSKNPSLYDEQYLRTLDADSNGYLSIGGDSIVYSNVPAQEFRNTKLTFLDGSYFDHETSIYLNRDSYIRIDESGWIENLPLVDSRDASFILETGDVVFTQGSEVSEEGLRKLSYSNRVVETQSSPMTILSNDKIVAVDLENKFSAYYFKASEDEPLNAQLARNIRSARSQIDSSSYNDLVHTFYEGSRALEESQGYSSYLKEAREILNVELESMDSELFNSIKSMSFEARDDFLRDYQTNIAISADRVNEILKDTKYKDYYKILDVYRDFHVHYETVGSGEQGVSLDEEAFGLRQAFYRYPAN